MLGLERETRIELATPAARRAVLCLGSICSTTELVPYSVSDTKTGRDLIQWSPPRRYNRRYQERD